MPAGHGTATRELRGPVRLTVLLLAAVVTVAVVRALLVQSFVVPSGSMEPTVQVGDRVLVSRLAYRFGGIERGDVIVFNGNGTFDPLADAPDGALAQLGRGLAESFSMPVGAHDYVKRVVGLPGERVACCDRTGSITVDGAPLDEPYLDPSGSASAQPFDVIVPAGRLWVMGDHRNASADSRAHLGSPGGGTVPVDSVIGRVVGIYWPAARAGELTSTEQAAEHAVEQAVEQAEGRR
jgi:signal peptidase I